MRRASGAAYIEPEHLLMGIMRCGDPQLELLKLRNIEGVVRAELPTKSHAATTSTNADVALSNRSKRVLANAMEEADRLNSRGIGPEHLLLGVLRESDSIAARSLLAHGIDLNAARRLIGSLSTAREPATASAFRARVASFATRARRARYWISAMQFAILVLLGFVLAYLPISGKQLIWIGLAWLLTVCARVVAWRLMEPSGSFKFSAHQGRLAMFLIYTRASLFQLFLFGWLIPVGLGVYRLAVR